MAEGIYDTKRLVKIEDKLDKLSESVVAIARIEERVITVLKHIDRFFIRLDRLEERVDVVEIETASQKKALSFTERFFWIIITTGVGTGVGVVVHFTKI